MRFDDTRRALAFLKGELPPNWAGLRLNKPTPTRACVKKTRIASCCAGDEGGPFEAAL
jgi:hypothetical protein